jgi:hypothetical protein
LQVDEELRRPPLMRMDYFPHAVDVGLRLQPVLDLV